MYYKWLFNNIIIKFAHDSKWKDLLMVAVAKVKDTLTATDQMHYIHKSLVKMGTTQN